jgi:molecular chaperone GrpE
MMTDKEQNAADAPPRDDAPADAGEQPEAANGNGPRDIGADAGAAPEAEAEAEDWVGQGGETAEQPAAGRGSGEVAALKDRHLRLAAEFDNYRKRVERERSETWVRAQAQLAERLLEPLDDLERIRESSSDGSTAGAVGEAVEMVRRKLIRSLEAAGLEAIEAADQLFDPTVHEALTTVPAASPEEDDLVAQVYQQGYRFKGVLLRPARVVVKKHQA